MNMRHAWKGFTSRDGELLLVVGALAWEAKWMGWIVVNGREIKYRSLC